jgi:hypothetical protein
MESYVAACVEPNNFSFLKSQCLRVKTWHFRDDQWNTNFECEEVESILITELICAFISNSTNVL